MLQLLGASDGFIRRPFLYLGAWYGLGAGAVALALIGAAGAALRVPLAELSRSYGSPFVLHGWTCCMVAWSCSARCCWAGWVPGW